ncbi:MAG: hypothetical protein L3K25_00155 [Gammaproteobacteria bacterium]|nr:hypothetical protein [Gammaproteobacteria bacterium]
MATISQCGSIVWVTNRARCPQDLKTCGNWLVGLNYNTNAKGLLAIVMRAEGRGQRAEGRGQRAEGHDFLVNIPMVGTVKSLNIFVLTQCAPV